MARCKISTSRAVPGVLAWVVAFATAIAAPHAAYAQGDATNEETARIAFTEGLRLRDEDKKPTEALEKLRAAYKLAPTPRTAYELGRTHLALGDLLAAQRLFLEVGRMPADPHASAQGQKARDESRRLEVDLEQRIPAVVLKLTGPGAGQAEVKVDSVVVPPEAVSLPWKVNPGTHSVSVKVPNGQAQTKSVSLVEGKTEDVLFEVAASATPPAATLPASVPEPISEQPAAGSWSKQRTTALVVGGVGVVALGVGTFLALSAKSTYDSAQCGTRAGVPDPNGCTDAGLSDRSGAGTKADVATVLFAVGALAVAGGAVLWLTAPRSSRAGVTALGVAPNGVVLRAELP